MKKVEEKKDAASGDEFDYENLYNLPKTYKTIGVPRESFEGENRVAIIPNHVLKLRKKGFAVQVEEGAGENAGF